MTSEALHHPSRDAVWLAPYWDGLEAGELRLPRCSACGRWAWYPIESGPACQGAHYTWQAVGPLATVFTFTRVDRPLLVGVTQGYVTGLVITDQAPDCRVAALFDETDRVVSIGARVRIAFSGERSSRFPYFRVEAAR